MPSQQPTERTADLPEHVRENRTYWDGVADQWVDAGRDAWDSAQPYWGIWKLPEAELRLLPEDMSGLRTIELGCGTGYVSGWMARRGATVVGIDNSVRQLETARRLSAERGVPLELHHGNAESVPLPDASFDFAISEYGAAIWCDPKAWIPEAHRLLRPGGELVFLGTTPLASMATPLDGSACEPHLHRAYFDLYRLDWRDLAVDPSGVEFCPPISMWLRLFRETGFDVLDFLELQAPEGVEGTRFSSPAEWSRRWPSEQVWKLRKSSRPGRKPPRTRDRELRGEAR